MSADISSEAESLYDVLGVAPNATGEEIRRAYRSLVRALHPDANPSQGSAERFTIVARAYATLSDGQRRLNYDAARRPLAPGRVRQPHGTRAGGLSRSALRGADVEARVEISLREAAFGVDVRVHVPRREVCAVCLGRGVAEGGVSTQCPVCHGTGGTRNGADECAHCRGSGVVGEPACPACLGSGRRRGLTSMVVSIPPAVEPGVALLLKGDGDVGPRNGPRGDLFLHVDVRPDPVLRRQGIDILMNLPISPGEAETGCSVDVPTLRGPRKLIVPPRTADRTLFRIAGAGLRPHGSWHKGDQFVTVIIAPGREDEPLEP